MSDIEIMLREDNPTSPAKSKSWHLSLPADVAVKRVLNALIPKLGLPIQQQDGRPVGYRLYHVSGGTLIPDDVSLSGAGVGHRDTCLLLRELVTGGARRAPEPAAHLKPEKTPQVRPQKVRQKQEGPQETVPINIPPNLRYSDQHMWIDTSSGVGRVGITDFLVQKIFFIVDVELPQQGQRVTAGEIVSTLLLLSENVDDLTLSVPSPVSGVIHEVNKHLSDRLLRDAEPELIQEDPYGRGWLFSVQLSGNSREELGRLMDARTYQRFARGE